MAKYYQVEIKETLSRIVSVPAELCNGPEDAIDRVRRQYNDEEYVLDSDDYVDTDFSCLDLIDTSTGNFDAPEFGDDSNGDYNE